MVRVSSIAINIILFIIFGFVLYLLLFKDRINSAGESVNTLKEIYLFENASGVDGENVENLFRLASDIHRVESEKQGDTWTKWWDVDDVDDDEQEKNKNKDAKLRYSLGDDSSAGVDGGDIGGVTKNVLTDSIKNGVLNTVTPEMSATVDESIMTLRNLLGANTYRLLDDEDINGVIMDLVVPKMYAAVAKVYHDRQESGGGGGSTEDTCSEECGEKVRRMVDAVLDPAVKSPEAALLEAAWQNCPSEMRDACTGEMTNRGTAADKCEFGCSRIHKDNSQIFKIPISGWIPIADGDDSGWSVAELGEGERCGDSIKDDSVDAVYHGRMTVDGPKQCYVHSSDGKPVAWRATEGIDDSILTYKGDANITIPGMDSKVVSEEIFEQIQAIYSPFDISPFDTLVYAELKSLDTDFSANSSWYKDVFMSLTHRLKSASKKKDLVVPSLEYFNDKLGEMSGREFISDVVWPVAVGSVYLQVRETRMNSSDSYMPVSESDDINLTHVFNLSIASLSVIVTLLAYFLMSIEAISRKHGYVTMRLFLEKYHRNFLALSVIVVFWTVVFTQMTQGRARAMFNRRIREKNTREFMANFKEMRSYLFGLTSTYPDLNTDPRGDEHKASLKDLMVAVHTDNIDAIQDFEDNDAMMAAVLTDGQKIKIMEKAQRLIKSYDSCNSVTPGNPIPYPIAEVVTYGTGAVVFVLLMMYMHRKFSIHEVVDRVQKVQMLRKRVYMGEGGAGAELNAILACATDSGENRIKIIKELLVAAGTMFSLIISGSMILSSRDYRASLEGGFMVSRSRCVT